VAAIKKARARKFCARGTPSVGVYPHGVGGVEGKPVYTITIGEHTVYLARDEFDAVSNMFHRMDE
jgi:hypothetical protein